MGESSRAQKAEAGEKLHPNLRNTRGIPNKDIVQDFVSRSTENQNNKILERTVEYCDKKGKLKEGFERGRGLKRGKRERSDFWKEKGEVAEKAGGKEGEREGKEMVDMATETRASVAPLGIVNGGINQIKP